MAKDQTGGLTAGVSKVLGIVGALASVIAGIIAILSFIGFMISLSFVSTLELYGIPKFPDEFFKEASIQFVKDFTDTIGNPLAFIAFTLVTAGLLFTVYVVKDTISEIKSDSARFRHIVYNFAFLAFAGVVTFFTFSGSEKTIVYVTLFAALDVSVTYLVLLSVRIEGPNAGKAVRKKTGGSRKEGESVVLFVPAPSHSILYAGVALVVTAIVLFRTDVIDIKEIIPGYKTYVFLFSVPAFLAIGTHLAICIKEFGHADKWRVFFSTAFAFLLVLLLVCIPLSYGSRIFDLKIYRVTSIDYEENLANDTLATMSDTINNTSDSIRQMYRLMGHTSEKDIFFDISKIPPDIILVDRGVIRLVRVDKSDKSWSLREVCVRTATNTLSDFPSEAGAFVNADTESVEKRRKYAK